MSLEKYPISIQNSIHTLIQSSYFTDDAHSSQLGAVIDTKYVIHHAAFSLSSSITGLDCTRETRPPAESLPSGFRGREVLQIDINVSDEIIASIFGVP
jgi:hypothetical protein